MRNISNGDQKRRVRLMLAGVAVLGATLLVTMPARADLVLDLRAAGINGVMFPTPGKYAGAAPGSTINLRLYAVISGSNGINDEQVTNAFGSVVSVGGVLGNMSGGVTPPFDGRGSQNGAIVDLDGDGDLDLGAPVGSTGAAVSGYFFARSEFPTGGSAISPNSEEIEVGHFDWTVTGFGVPDFLLNYIVRVAPDGGPSPVGAVWYEDGTVKNPTIGSYRAGTPVQIPEPAGAVIAGILGSAGILRRRCRQN